MTERIRVTLRAELRSGMHILGPGRTLALVDRPVELDARGYPVIPASSLRGRLRAHLERLLRGLDLPACTPPNPERMCPHAWGAGAGPAGDYCLACRIFGSPWRPAAVASGDLQLIDPEPNADLYRSERTSVGISRRLGTAQEELLFVLEATTARLGGRPLSFEGTMNGRLTAEEAGWLLAAVPLVTHLGGSKARGLGELSLRVREVAWWRDGAWQPAEAAGLIEEALDHGAA
jgi:CRISPR/Cas system CSM-associated protein Csm3 (group 7 of RAMP superfamily)